MVETDDMLLSALPDSHINVDYFGSPWSYGVQALDRDGHLVVYNLVRKGASFPAKGEREILVEQKSAGKMLVIVVENGNPTEVASVAESTTVGEMEMPIPPGLTKYVKVRIAFELDECGILTVDALVPETNNRQQMKLQKDRDVPPEKIEKTTQRVSQLGLPETQNNASSAMQDKSKKKVYGIDLGTTYSAIAVVNEEGQAEIVPNAEGDRKTASAVFFEPSYEPGRPSVVVGRYAKEVAYSDPEHFVGLVKYHMGSADWKREIEGISWTPEMISAEIIKELVRGVGCAERDQAVEKVRDIVIAYPVYFDIDQKMAVKSACELAGLNVLKAISEPEAVALHYGLNNVEEPQTAVVYDLGGGTFNVTVVRTDGNSIEVVCSDGNHNLGGKDWTARVVRYLAEKFAEENGVSTDDLLNDPETLTELSLGAETLKCTLSLRPKAKRKVRHNDISSRIEIDRDTFNALTKSLLDETEDLTRKMMDFSRSKGVEKFDRFLLAGGGSNMPQVQEMAKEKFGAQIEHEPEIRDADEAVAKGAAIYGSLFDSIGIAPLPIPPEAPNKILCVGLDVCVKNEANKTMARFGDFLARGDELPIMEKSILFSGPLPLADGGLYVSLIASLAHGTEEVARIFIGVPKPTIKTDFDIWVKVGISETGELTMRVGDNNSKSVFKSVLPLDEERYLKESADHSWPGVLEVE